jgi:hypothetical protein
LVLLQLIQNGRVQDERQRLLNLILMRLNVLTVASRCLIYERQIIEQQQLIWIGQELTYVERVQIRVEQRLERLFVRIVDSGRGTLFGRLKILQLDFLTLAQLKTAQLIYGIRRYVLILIFN